MIFSSKHRSSNSSNRRKKSINGHCIQRRNIFPSLSSSSSSLSVSSFYVLLLLSLVLLSLMDLGVYVSFFVKHKYKYKYQQQQQQQQQQRNGVATTTIFAKAMSTIKLSSKYNKNNNNNNDNNNSNKPLIIFCHGSGDTGRGVQAWLESLLPSIVMDQFDWIFPSAEPIPYTIQGGRISSIWYDRIGGFDPTFPEQTISVERSTTRLMTILQEQILERRRRNNNTTPKIILGGFSMGGAIAYQTAARWNDWCHQNNSEYNLPPIDGIIALSCYLNHDSKVWSILLQQEEEEEQQQQEKINNNNTNNNNSIQHSWPKTFIAHGAEDDFILPQWGQSTFERFQNLRLPVEFHLLPNMHHEMTSLEMQKVVSFINENFLLENDTNDNDDDHYESTTTNDNQKRKRNDPTEMTKKSNEL